MPENFHGTLARLTPAILQIPLPAGYPHCGAAQPMKAIVADLRRAGWPIETIEVPLPQVESSGRNRGQQVNLTFQPVAVVPEPWLRRLAEGLGWEWVRICRRVTAG